MRGPSDTGTALDAARIEAEPIEHRPFVPHQPLLDDLVVLHQAMRDGARDEIAPGRRTVRPVSRMGAGCEGMVRADEAVRPALSPHHVFPEPPARVGKGGEFLTELLITVPKL